MAEIKFYENPAACGTEHYYNLSFLAPLVSTDGVQEMFGLLACFWIGDIVASYIPKIDKMGEDFLSVKVIAQDGKATFTVDDGNDKILITQKIEYTDLKENVHMFLQPGEVGDKAVWVLMLPSEY